MSWNISSILTAQSQYFINQISETLNNIYSRDDLTQNFVNKKHHKTLAFNISLLQESRLQIIIHGKCFYISRTIVITGLEPYGMTTLCHIFVDESGLPIFMICGGLFNEPLAFYNPSSESLMHASGIQPNQEALVRAAIGKIGEIPELVTGKTVCLYAGPLNYIHDLMNSLSGFSIATEMCAAISLLECERSFFGPTASFASPGCSVEVQRAGMNAVSTLSRDQPMIVARPVAFHARPSIVSSLRGDSKSREPSVVLAVRGGGRVCLNESEFLAACIDELASKGALRFVILGWVWPESAPQARRNVFAKAAAEANERAEAVSAHTSADATIEIVSGRDMRDTIAAISASHFYVSPCGTLHHFVSWFSKAEGVVFGPEKDLKNAENWHQRFPGAIPGTQLPGKFVREANTQQARGNFSIDLAAANFVAETAEKVWRRRSIQTANFGPQAT